MTFARHAGHRCRGRIVKNVCCSVTAANPSLARHVVCYNVTDIVVMGGILENGLPPPPLTHTDAISLSQLFDRSNKIH